MHSPSSRRPRSRLLRLETLEARLPMTLSPFINLATGSPPRPGNTSGTDSPSVSVSTGEKPQSKVWEKSGTWFSVLPDNTGTWVRRLDGAEWTNLVKLTTDLKVQADVKTADDLVHVLLFDGTQSQLASLEFLGGETPTYQPWTLQPLVVDVLLSEGVETATIDFDSKGRLWLASDAETTMEVRYSDFPYMNFSEAITIAADTTKDDICAIAAMPSGEIGVMWSNQNSRAFGFRTHADDTDPAAWSESVSIRNDTVKSKKGGFADDHINLVVAQDGTLYAAIKTSFDKRGAPQIGLLVRRPNGTWDPLYSVDTAGTRPIVVLNEATQRLAVIYTKATSGGGDIVYRESSLGAIGFGARKTLLKGKLNDATSTRKTLGSEIVVLAGGKKTATGRLSFWNPAALAGQTR